MSDLSPAQPSMTASACAAVGLLTADEMSGILHVSIQTLATWRCKRRGPPSIKLGKKVFYLLTDFNTWMQDEAKRQRTPVHAHASQRQAPQAVKVYSPTEDSQAAVHVHY